MRRRESGQLPRGGNIALLMRRCGAGIEWKHNDAESTWPGASPATGVCCSVCTQLRRTSGHVALQTAVLLRRRWWIIRHLLPMSGALVAVLGTLLMISVNVQWLGFIPALLSRVDSREVAWGRSQVSKTRTGMRLRRLITHLTILTFKLGRR